MLVLSEFKFTQPNIWYFYFTWVPNSSLCGLRVWMRCQCAFLSSQSCCTYEPRVSVLQHYNMCPRTYAFTSVDKLCSMYTLNRERTHCISKYHIFSHLYISLYFLINTPTRFHKYSTFLSPVHPIMFSWCPVPTDCTYVLVM